MSLVVTVEDVQFQAGEGQYGFFLSRFDGWFDGVDMRVDAPDRPLAPGAFDAPGYAGARLIELSGLCHAQSAEQLTYFGRVLTGLLGAGELGQITVREPGLTTWASVCRLDKPDFRVVLWGQTASYSVQFIAHDPRKYGEVTEFTRPQYSTFSSNHRGNTTASPVYVIDGDFPNGYELRGPNGLKYRVTIPVQVGYPHEIDMLTGLLRVGGNVATSGGIEIADTWRIASGRFIDQQLAPIGGVGSGTVTARVTDTFI